MKGQSKAHSQAMTDRVTPLPVVKKVAGDHCCSNLGPARQSMEYGQPAQA